MRNVLSKENVQVLAKSIHLYMDTIKSRVMLKISVDLDIERLIEDMIISEKVGAENLKGMEDRTAQQLARDEQVEKDNLEWGRRQKVKDLKSAAMLN